MNYRYNPTIAELLIGQIDAALLEKKGGYVAWTRDWEGPLRPEVNAARADLRDRFVAEVVEILHPLYNPWP